MGPLKSLSLVLLLSGLALGQATMIGGYASNWAPAYGVYAAPFVPLVVTPRVWLATESPSPVGASSTAFGNLAGARNSTLEIASTPPPVAVYTVPVFYGAKPHGAALAGIHREREMEMEMRGGMAGMMHEEKARPLEVGLASFQHTHSVAQLMAGAGPAKKASRTYTNADIDRFNQSTGNVKYDGKTEKMN
ncbi:MAG TPA: hypothetical protein VKB77_05970 [Terriglobales bacterium]|nr:hypothetical protein [Terriglobales bacterium]